MSKILLLSNKEDLASRLQRDVERMNHTTYIAKLDDATKSINARTPDLVLVDLTLPGGIIQVWQQLQYDMDENYIPTIVIISRDRLMELELLPKMSDFAAYPYDVRELEVRINLILGSQPIDDEEEIIKIGNLAIDMAKYEINVDGKPIMLTLKEYDLLKYLATRRGRVITRQILLDEVWGYNYYGGTRTVDVHIGRLRTKIETGEYSFIRTVRGVGYVFSDEYPKE